MWTVTITKGVNQSNQKTFTLTYVNTETQETFVETFLWDGASSVNALAYNRIQQLTTYDALVEGPFTPTTPQNN